MTSRTQDHVHRLIHSMSSAERRYYKLYNARNLSGGRSNHQLLFDAYAAMEEYDEEVILSRFKHEGIVRHIAITKRRLYEGILKALEAYHAEYSLDARLHRSINQVELLFQRGLHEDAAKVLASVRKAARKHDRQPALVAVLHWEKRLLEEGNYSNAKEEHLDQLASEGEQLRREQQELDELWDLKGRILLILYRQGQVRDANSQARVEQLLEHPLLQDPDRLLTARGRFLFHHLHAAAAFAMGRLEVCNTHLSANRTLLYAEQERFSHEPELVLSVLSNLAYVQLRTGQFQAADHTLKEFRQCPATWKMAEHEDLEQKLFTTSASLELGMHARTGDFGRALEMVPFVERGLARYAQRMGNVRKAGFYFQLAYVHFGNGEWDKAMKWCNRLFNDIRIDDSAEIIAFGRVLYLLCLIEVKDQDLLHYTLRNTERFMQTRQRAHRFESIFLETVRELARTRDETSQEEVLQRFENQLHELENDPREQVVFDHVDVLAWTQARRSGRPFAELVRERAVSATKAA